MASLKDQDHEKEDILILKSMEAIKNGETEKAK
jgi:hypothetical protein